MYHIPACPEGDTFAMVVIEGRTDRADIGDKRYSEFCFLAKQIADDLVADLTDHGVFLTAGETATGEELEAARIRERECYGWQIFETDAKSAKTHNVLLVSGVARPLAA
jgi:hypothetical protein